MAGLRVLLLGLCFGLFHYQLAASGVRDRLEMLCSEDDVPACAQNRDNGMYFLFGNECDLRKAQRGNLMDVPLYDVALRYCFPSCEFECSRRYQPVCGQNPRTGERKTFRSRCEMVRTSCLTGLDWLVQRWGVCPKANALPLDQKPPQPVPCTKVYRPVCAMYAGVKSTFSNECLVNAENIKTQRNWRIVSEGLCGEDSTKMKQSRKYKPQAKPKLDADRMKRSHERRNNLVSRSEEFQIPEDAVEIYAPSTFHTQFISNTGAMEKSYSLPARKPYMVTPPKSKERRVYGSGIAKYTPKSCVFGSEPICGVFQGHKRTFSSVCQLMEYSQRVGNAWTISHDGACRSCNKPCPTIYQPLCATRNGINHTIINECYLERVRCKDPKSIWKISHKGECPKSRNNAPIGIPTEKSRPLPSVLYAKRIHDSTTVKPLFKKPLMKSTTTKVKRTFKTTPPSLEVNNRKIRKIEMDGFPGFGGSSYSSYAKSDEEASWSSNDNWLVQQTLHNVKGYFNKKPASFKKAYGEKYSQRYPGVTSTSTSTTTSSTTTSTTTEAPPPPPPPQQQLPVFLSFASNELLNQDIDDKTAVYNDEDAQLVLMLTSSTTTLPPPSTTQPTTTAATTELASRADTSTSPSTEATMEDSTTDPTTTEEAPISTPAVSTTEAEEPFSQTTESESSTTEAATELPNTTQNVDYTADDSLGDSSGQTSIYGLDKNSLIMRLLRARSSQNVFF
ncbi:hypothetical protein KR009_009821 [Drosophila setifemur]|nr:hypothetical protein KR009_009821 [Drosophila setifemur]